MITTQPGVTIVQQAAPPTLISRENCLEATGIKPDDLLLVCERLGVPVSRPMRGVVLVELALLLEALRTGSKNLPRKVKNEAKNAASSIDETLAANGFRRKSNSALARAIAEFAGYKSANSAHRAIVHRTLAIGLGRFLPNVRAIVSKSKELSMLIEVEKVRMDGGTQSRATIDQSIVEEYAEAMKGAADFPDITVFYDGADYWLADGFHRFEAAKKNGAKYVRSSVRQGARRDAVLYSCGANSAHGLRRTNEDKRRAVMTLLSDEEWSKQSDRWIADKCGVHHDLVAKVRRELPQVAVSANSPTEPTTRTGKDGKQYPTRKRKTEDNADPAPAQSRIPSAPPALMASPVQAEVSADCVPIKETLLAALRELSTPLPPKGDACRRRAGKDKKKIDLLIAIISCNGSYLYPDTIKQVVEMLSYERTSFKGKEKTERFYRITTMIDILARAHVEAYADEFIRDLKWEDESEDE